MLRKTTAKKARCSMLNPRRNGGLCGDPPIARWWYVFDHDRSYKSDFYYCLSCLENALKDNNRSTEFLIEVKRFFKIPTLNMQPEEIKNILRGDNVQIYNPTYL